MASSRDQKKPEKSRKKRRDSRRAEIAGKPGKKPPRKGLAKFFYGLMVVLVWAVILLIPVTLYYAHDLPDVTDIEATPGRDTVMILDQEGEILASYGNVYGEWLDMEDIPAEFVQALVATEDRRFFGHFGIDIRGLARAVWQNLSNRSLVEGGSTITQQLAKNLFLSSEKTVKRKIQEMLLSFWLEMNFSKEEILTIYANRVYFGAGAYGIDAAARTYFGHDARNLSLTEAAMLAGVLKGPALYSPFRDLQRAYQRTEEVLDNMVDASFIKRETAERAKKADVNIAGAAATGDFRYYTDWIFEQIPDLIGQPTEPIVVYTTLKQNTQMKAAGAVQQIMDREGVTRNASQAALVSMDPDGAVRAMIGGRDYGQSQFNRVSQARRQPGSAFKLFVYLAALERGLTPQTTMRDSPVILDGWEPGNYTGDYLGEITLETAFANSINTVAVKLAEKINRRNVSAMARRLGITTPIVEEPSMALGTSEVSLLEMTAAYAAVFNGGYKVVPYGILEIQNSAGQILYRHMPGPPEQVLAPATAQTMQEMLARVVTEGTAKAARMDFPVAGKTGTTQSYKDALFIGAGLDTVNGVWVGNDDASAMNKVTGGGTPARIWKNFMLRVSLDRNDATLVTPNVSPRTKPGNQ
ncbi:transglycosylase domain-containing protein [Emcibacter nanhaiensis]|uniref:PBP1A family penicillin-binding protein n=1 Tax=Emcibacter nanhaiensis TaxID=1505037 RepID=A0A501PMI6_9PROT|nr:PBP1A family penicillin-binding protein [Emcibacter nanhaiensis]TPD61505.1 PBP1A family penicillin-binding protein [Emcibacter nanhaiensis]